MVPPFRRFLQQMEGIMKRHENIPVGDRMEQEAEKLPFFATHTGKTVSALLMVMIVVIILVINMGSGGSIAYEMDDTKLAVVCLNRGPVFVAYDAITGVSLADTFRMDRTVEAEQWDDGWCGIYENEEYGRFTLFAYSSAGTYIVVEYEDGVLIFNDKSEKSTRKAYEKLLERMG